MPTRSSSNKSEPIQQPSKLANLVPELLEIIFLEHFRADTLGHTFCRNASPWVVARVCRRWRQVALATPSLWSIIRIDTGHLLAPKQPLRMLQKYLTRSQPMRISCLLDLGWDRVKESKGHGRRLNSQIVRALVAHSRRWCNVEITFMRSGSSLWPEFKALNDMPELRFLSLHGDMIGAYSQSEKLRELSGIFSRAPQLREAKINTDLPLFNRYFHVDDVAPGTPFLILPWSQLQELTLRETSPQQLLKVLSSLVNLEFLDATVDRYLYNGEFDGQGELNISHPKLRCLSLTGHDIADFRIFTSRFVAPALQDFRISRPSYYSRVQVRNAESETWPIAPLYAIVADYVEHAKASLRLIDTDMSAFSTPDFPDVLQGLYSVEQINLRRAGMKDLSTLRNLEQGAFPNLKCLRLIFEDDVRMGTGVDFWDWELLTGLLDMVKTRSGDLKRLSFCVTRRGKPVEGPIFLSEYCEQLFRQLVELGQGHLDLCGNLVDGKWVSSDMDDHWTALRKERRIARFGNTGKMEADHIADWRGEDSESYSDTDSD
ncbi:hypothetical protein VNI00_003824 [Paramarasmius palmivorus]|uniref:F-box domain-containing protein n=1 Tax=Paramarasmius palmivorus TaxID=297713 RepID=A0AAW0DPA4_9AGAR